MPKSRHRASHKAKSAQFSNTLRETRLAAQRRDLQDRLRRLNPNALQVASQESGRTYAAAPGAGDHNAFSHLNA